MATTAHQGSKHYNRLGLEKSPYLLQHATNPVNWYPWGQEAFEKAKTEGKIIFLSVGYSTCHWCHVMEKESFENEEIGKILNENFIPIKVDREERPDIDQVYMSFIQASTGQGGWPMNVWLTPDLKPVVGGTYFPPDDKYGRPGFKAVLLHIADNWKKNRTGIEKQGSNILNALAEHTSTTSSSNSTMPSEDITEMCYKTLEQTYDREKGGFGSAPKFPQPVNLRFLLRLCGPGSSEHGQTATDMCKHTLMMMSKGGIWDHIAKGFHRYSTDGDWHVPHFEKMLYDQAQLVVAYCEAYQVTKKERFATVVKDILDYVNNELSHKSGGFYSAMDADSLPSADSVEKKEGAFYVWKKDDIHSVLSAPLPGNNTKTDGDMFCHHFNVKPNGNVHPDKDPQGELKGENVLIELGDVGDTAKQFGLTANQVQDILGESKSKLLEVRKHRPVPHLDSKMVTAWNGLMISGFAKASQVIGDPAYKERALKAVQFVRQHLYDPELGILYRSCYTGDDGEVTQISTPIQGFADDYVFMVQGLIDAYEASFQDHLIHWAEQLQKKMDDLFWDNTSGGYFTSRDGDSSVILRVKGDQDGAEPSANSVAATNLLRLSSLLNNAEWKDRARRIFVAFQDRLQSMPHALPEMVRAFMSCQTHGIQIIVLGDREADDTRSLLECIHSHYLADRTLILADGSTDGYMYERLPLLSTLTKIDGKATAYVCRDFSCLPPVNSVQRLNELLKQEVGA